METDALPIEPIAYGCKGQHYTIFSIECKPLTVKLLILPDFALLQSKTAASVKCSDNITSYAVDYNMLSNK
ncbi:hypothetical protein CXF62_05320 [Psychrobacter sp. MES7-P7E]|nr:hypothetical protein CXF62_05320 [Psychrobacter sp. MES7-P7E]